MLVVGSHQPARGRLEKAFERSVREGNQIIQVHGRNPNKWNPPLIPASSIYKCHHYSEVGNLTVFVKGSNLINLATPDKDWQSASLQEMATLFLDAGYLKATAVVISPGFHLKSGPRAGLARAIEQLNAALHNRGHHFVKVIIQPSAGNGTAIGSRFEELGYLVSQIHYDYADLVEVSFDTCNAFAAGYDIATEQGLEETLAAFDNHIGLSKLGCVHLKDSDFPLASRKDATAILGDGDIGAEALKRVTKHPALQKVPFIVEQPKGISLDQPNPNFVRLVEWLNEK